LLASALITPVAALVKACRHGNTHRDEATGRGVKILCNVYLH
jgi:hypothetical protein